MRRRDRVLRAGALAAAAAAVLAGCAIPLPEVEADPPVEGPQPALDEPRIERVLDSVAAVLAEGDAAADAALLEPRLNGPALETRLAEYALAQATAGSEDEATTPQQLTTEPQVVAVSQSETWPKTIFVFTEIAEGMNTPLLIGLQQDEPRADYRLFSWVRLLPEVTTPATAVIAEGSPQVAPDAEGLRLSPVDTVAAYASALADTESEQVATFTEDVFRTLVSDDRIAIAESVEDAGEYSEAYAADPDFVPVSLQTADGGAIVFGAIGSTHTYERTIDDSEMTVGGQIALLAGEAEGIEVEESVTASYHLMVAFYVPADPETQIQVLGAERVLQSVTTE
ncbi:hypothetical protein [Pseudactinotalea terrae]|uniref:hypothetical protein n=1 Tax=Pseudactinotalea terrae TaxID=1743262 RepID=UPI0012E1EF72|nr:hypothetical protein [Pseudactinotalea terrae]